MEKPEPAPQQTPGNFPMQACILSVGDELVNGVTVETNSAWISRRLAGAGAAVCCHATVGDDQPALESRILELAPRCDLLVITGGIGPTPDDLTRESLAAVLNVSLVEHGEWLDHLREVFRARGRPMREGNRKQAGIPHGAQLLWNPAGTAAGIVAQLVTSHRPGGTRIFVLPGVPREMQAMFDLHLLPFLRAQRSGGRVRLHRALHTFGLGESDVAARLGDLLRRREAGEDLQVGTTAARGVVSIRIYAGGCDEAEAARKLDAVEREARKSLGPLVFGRDDETLGQAVGELLRADPRRPILSTAESCTGGLIAARITDVAGASDYFHRGFITYADEAKIHLLGVGAGLIATHGAVSEPVAEAMARGALPRDGFGIALSVSGIAGPGGATEEKPVGTVCFGLAAGTGQAAYYVFTRTFRFAGDRQSIRERSADMSLTLLRFYLINRNLAQLPF